MGVWFTSDPHFGHTYVAGLRGFDSTAEHDAHLTLQWMQRVQPGDEVWVLGDLAASSPAHALNVIEHLPGRKHLIAGNHDRCHPMHRQAHKFQRLYLEVFASVAPFARRRINGTEVLLSHFPYAVDREEPRYMQYRLRDEGAWLLHGHLHASERVTSRREIHVGVDAWDLAPVHLDTIATLMEDAK